MEIPLLHQSESGHKHRGRTTHLLHCQEIPSDPQHPEERKQVFSIRGKALRPLQKPSDLLYRPNVLQRLPGQSDPSLLFVSESL